MSTGQDPVDELIELLKEAKAQPYWSMWHLPWPDCLWPMFPQLPPPGCVYFRKWVRPS